MSVARNSIARIYPAGRGWASTGVLMFPSISPLGTQSLQPVFGVTLVIYSAWTRVTIIPLCELIQLMQLPLSNPSSTYHCNHSCYDRGVTGILFPQVLPVAGVQLVVASALIQAAASGSPSPTICAAGSQRRHNQHDQDGFYHQINHSGIRHSGR